METSKLDLGKLIVEIANDMLEKNSSSQFAALTLKQAVNSGSDPIEAFSDALAIDSDHVQTIGQVVIDRANHFLETEMARLKTLKQEGGLTESDRVFGTKELPALINAMAKLGALLNYFPDD